MLEFIVLGQVPGTHIQLTLLQIAIILSAFLVGMLGYSAVRAKILDIISSARKLLTLEQISL